MNHISPWTIIICFIALTASCRHQQGDQPASVDLAAESKVHIYLTKIDVRPTVLGDLSAKTLPMDFASDRMACQRELEQANSGYIHAECVEGTAVQYPKALAAKKS